MKISELIQELEKYKSEHGDVVLYSNKGDGRSAWCGVYSPTIKRETQSVWSRVFQQWRKTRIHVISDHGW